MRVFEITQKTKLDYHFKGYFVIRKCSDTSSRIYLLEKETLAIRYSEYLELQESKYTKKSVLELCKTKNKKESKNIIFQFWNTVEFNTKKIKAVEIFDYKDFAFLKNGINISFDPDIKTTFNDVPEIIQSYLNSIADELKLKCAVSVREFNHLVQIESNNYQIEILNINNDKLHPNHMFYLLDQLKEYLEKIFRKESMLNSKLTNTFYVFANPDESNKEKINIYKINVDLKTIKNEIIINFSTESYFEFVPGSVSKCIKVDPNSKTEVDLSSFIRVYSLKDSKNNDFEFGFEDYTKYIYFCNKNNSLFDFFVKNQKFMKSSGFDQILPKLTQISDGGIAFYFTSYLSLISKYPAIIKLTKSNGSNFVFNLIIEMCRLGSNNKNLNEFVRSLDVLINNNSEQGEIIKLPSYITQYLISSNAYFSDYVAWQNIQSVMNFTEEKFKELTSDVLFSLFLLKIEISDIETLFKYGYRDIYKLFEYIYKEADFDVQKIRKITDLLKTYSKMVLEMCLQEILYPEQLQETYNNLFPKYLSFIKNKIIEDL